jgi:hypothetical protein
VDAEDVVVVTVVLLEDGLVVDCAAVEVELWEVVVDEVVAVVIGATPY